MPHQSNIARFTVLQRLGTGGMAEVFLCRQSGIGGFGKLVVIKRILPHLVEDASFISMFLDEARIAANLSHPNIVQVFEIDADPRGIPYIVMEYVRGPSFSQVIRAATAKQALHPGRMSRLLEGAAKGLDHAHHAHDAGGRPLHIVHRDISPHNVLVSPEGVAKVADFGIAKADGRLTHTQAGIVKGKVRYTAPELLEAPEDGARPAADVFSLGVCAYLAMTGELPFVGDNDEAIMRAIHDGRFRRPREVRPELDAELDAILCRALAREPAARTPSARALADELRAWRQGHPEGTSDGELAAWLVELCPPQPVRLAAEEATGAIGPPLPVPPGLASPLPVSAPEGDAEVLDGADLLEDVEVVLTDSGAMQVVPARRTASVAAGVTLLLFLGAGGFAVWSARRQAAEQRQRVAEFTAVVDEAERQLAAGHFARADALIRTAQLSQGHTPEQDIRLSHLQADLRAGQLLAQARVALEAGQPAEAVRTTSEVLALEPEHQAARALLATARDALGQAEALARAEAAADAGAGVEPADKAPGGKRAGARRSPSAAREPQPDAGLPPAPEPPAPLAVTPPEPLALPQPVEVPVARDTGRVEQARAKSDGRALLRVTSTVRAQVFIDGLPVGFTPLEDREVHGDAHLVMVWAEGFTSITERVTVARGERVTLRFHLLRDPHAPRR